MHSKTVRVLGNEGSFSLCDIAVPWLGQGLVSGSPSDNRVGWCPRALVGPPSLWVLCPRIWPPVVFCPRLVGSADVGRLLPGACLFTWNCSVRGSDGFEWFSLSVSGFYSQVIILKSISINNRLYISPSLPWSLRFIFLIAFTSWMRGSCLVSF